MKIIRLSNLALRFYVADGWDAEGIQAYLEVGKLSYPSKDKSLYFILPPGTKLNKTKVLAECTLEHCWFWSDREKARTQEEIFDDYQW